MLKTNLLCYICLQPLLGLGEFINIDFCGPFPREEYLFVLVDKFSRFPVVEILKSLSTSAVVVTLEHVFSQYGIPHVLTSDNGLPFSGQLFASYLA